MVTTVNLGPPNVPVARIGAKSIVVKVLGGASVGGASGTMSKIAAEALSGHRAVLLDSNGQAAYPKIANAADGEQIVGVTTGAASLGATASIRTAGEMDESTWAWNRGPVFAGNDGVLTQTPPAGQWLRQIGVAVTATKVIIDLRPTIQL